MGELARDPSREMPRTGRSGNGKTFGAGTLDFPPRTDGETKESDEDEYDINDGREAVGVCERDDEALGRADCDELGVKFELRILLVASQAFNRKAAERKWRTLRPSCLSILLVLVRQHLGKPT